MSTFAGIDLGGTHTRIVVMADGEFVFSENRTTSEVMATGAGLTGIVAHYRDILSRTGLRPEVVGIGLPATLDAARRIVISAPNVRELEGIDVVAFLEDAFKVPVIAERDVNFQLFYDMRANDRTPSIAAGVYLGTGIGNSIWINGFYTGGHGSAAELGHIPMAGITDTCVCGKIGCLESVCCGRWLRDWWGAHAVSTPLSDLFVRYGDHPDIREFLELAAIGIATTINLFDPELLFLGGGVLDMPAFPIEHLKARVLARTRSPFPHDAIEILTASSQNDSGARGGCLYAASLSRGLG